jgi:hypothetical protein
VQILRLGLFGFSPFGTKQTSSPSRQGNKTDACTLLSANPTLAKASLIANWRGTEDPRRHFFSGRWESTSTSEVANPLTASWPRPGVRWFRSIRRSQIPSSNHAGQEYGSTCFTDREINASEKRTSRSESKIRVKRRRTRRVGWGYIDRRPFASGKDDSPIGVYSLRRMLFRGSDRCRAARTPEPA